MWKNQRTKTMGMVTIVPLKAVAVAEIMSFFAIVVVVRPSPNSSLPCEYVWVYLLQRQYLRAQVRY